MPNLEQLVSLSCDVVNLTMKHQPFNVITGSSGNTFRYKNHKLYATDMSRQSEDLIKITVLKADNTRYRSVNNNSGYQVQWSTDASSPIFITVKREDEEEYQNLRVKYRMFSAQVRRTLIAQHFFEKYQPSI